MKIKRTSELYDTIGVLFFFTGIFLVIEYYYSRLDIGPDQILQYVAAKQFALGNGWVRPILDINNLAEPNYIAHNLWPPGLTLILAPFFLVFNDIRIIHALFSLLNLSIFVFLAFRLFEKLILKKITLYWGGIVFLFFVVNGVFFFPSGSADILNINLVLLAFWVFINYLHTKKILYLGVTCLILVLTFYIRYAYFAALPLIPLFFIIHWLITKQKDIKSFAYSVLFLIVFTLPALLHILALNDLSDGFWASTLQKEDSFLTFSNLTWANPFPFTAFFNEIPFLRFLGYSSDFGYDRGYNYPYLLHILFWIVGLVLLIPVIFLFKKFLAHKIYSENIYVWGLYSSIFSLLIICFVYLSTLLTKSVYTGYDWYLGNVFRYYLFPVFLIQTAYFLIIYKEKYTKIRSFVILIIVGSFLYNGALLVYNYKTNYRFFNFEHNTSLLRNNARVYNSYLLQKSITPAGVNRNIALIDRSVKNQFFGAEEFLALQNIHASYLPEKSTKIESKPDMHIFLVFIKGETPFKKLEDNTDIQLSKRLANGFDIYMLRSGSILIE